MWNIFNWFGGSKNGLESRWGFAPQSDAGQPVTATTSLGNSSVWRGLSLISGDIATLKLHLYERDDRDNKKKATNHPAYNLMRWKPGVTANKWKRRTVAQMLLFGNSYSRIVRKQGVPIALEQLHPDDVTPYEHATQANRLVYGIRGKDGTEEHVNAENMFHVEALSLTKFGGLSLIEYARNTIGRHLAAESFTDQFFKNGVVKTGWFRLPPGMTMSKEAQDNFLQQVNDGKKYRAGMLEDGMEWVPSDISPRDAMMIEMLKLTPYDVARYMNCPPYKLGVTDGATQSASAEDNSDYWRSTIPPLLVAIEMEAWDKLLREDEKHSGEGGLFFEFKMDSILRASTLERYQVYRLAVSSKLMNPNECRAIENMNPYEGGDDFENPYTSTAVVDGGKNPVSVDLPTIDGGAGAKDSMTRDGYMSLESFDQRAANIARHARQVANASTARHAAGIVQDAFRRCAKRLSIAAEQAARNPTKYLDVLESVPGGHGATVREWLRPSVALAAELTGEPADEVLEIAVRGLLDAFHSRYLTAADAQPHELPTAVRAASERLMADAGGLANDLLLFEVTGHGN